MVLHSINMADFKQGDKVIHSGGCQAHCKGKYYTLTTRHASRGNTYEGQPLQYYWSTEEYSTGIWENFLTLVEPEPVVSCDWALRGPLGGTYNVPVFNYNTTQYHSVFAGGCPTAQFIKSNNKNYKDMNIIDKIRVNIKREPMKTLIKNDILTLDERLTGTGKELFNDFLYAKFKDEFIADLAPKLEGINDDSK